MYWLVSTISFNLKPQSSDDENAAKEEEEVLKLQSDKAKVLSMEDFGIETEPTFEVEKLD